MSGRKFSVTERIDPYSGYVAQSASVGSQVKVYYSHEYDRVIVRLGTPGEGPTVSLSPQAWETVIEAVTQVLNAIAVEPQNA